MKSSELSLPDFTLDMGLMRIDLPRNGSEGNKIHSCQIGCKAKTLGFLGECQGWHLLAYSQQESWSSSQLECRRNNPPLPVSLPGFYSQQRQAPCPGRLCILGARRSPSVVRDVSEVLCVRRAARVPAFQTASCCMPKWFFSPLELASAALLIIQNIWLKPKWKGLFCSAERR